MPSTGAQSTCCPPNATKQAASHRPLYAIFRQRLKTFLFCKSFPHILLWHFCFHRTRSRGFRNSFTIWATLKIAIDWARSTPQDRQRRTSFRVRHNTRERVDDRNRRPASFEKYGAATSCSIMNMSLIIHSFRIQYTSDGQDCRSICSSSVQPIITVYRLQKNSSTFYNRLINLTF